MTMIPVFIVYMSHSVCRYHREELYTQEQLAESCNIARRMLGDRKSLVRIYVYVWISNTPVSECFSEDMWYE